MIKLTKNIIRTIYYIPAILLLLVLYYISYGHKQYSILEKYQDIITYNINKQYGIDIKYEKLDEEWDYLKPNLDIKNIIIKDGQGNEFKSEQITVRLDLIYAILKQKVKIKKITFDNSIITYNHKESSEKNKFKLEDFDSINVNEIKINNLTLNLLYNDKQYNLENLNFKYDHSDDYFTLNYNGTEFKQHFIFNDYYKTEIISDSNSILKIIDKFGFSEELKNIGYNEIFKVDGNFKIDLNYKNNEDYNLEFYLDKAKVNLIKEKLYFSDFSGVIKFDGVNNKVYSDKLKCITNKKPCSLQINNNKNGDISLLFEAYADKTTLFKYVPFIDNNNFDGSTKINGIYNISKNDSMVITSDLSGLEINNIPFISKIKDQKLNLKIETLFLKKNPYLKVTLEGVQVLVDLKNYNTQVYLNQKDQLFSPIEKELYIKGEVDNLNVQETIEFIKKLKFDKIEDDSSKFSYNAELDLNYPNYLNINPERVIYRDNNGIIDIEIIDDYFQGKIFYDLKNNFIKLNMDKFFYQSIGQDNNENQYLKISEFPKIEATIQNLNINGYKGNISFNSYYNNQFYIIDNINGELNKIKPNFIIKVSQDNKNITTELISVNENKIIEFNNIADILDSYGYSNTLTSSSGVVYGNIYWSGLIPNLKTLNGNISFEIKEGRINTVSTGNRVLKVFKIFEVNMLSEIFKLDFDFIKKGTKYDTLNGNGNFVDGVYLIDKNIIMKSNSYNAKLSGKVDFVKEQFENNIKIDLPISQKLPTIALLSGNPAAIAGVWIADKLVGDKINSLSSINFNIKGDFEDPNISK